MNYDEDLNAPVWDDLASHDKDEEIAELKQSFANVSVGVAKDHQEDNVEHNEWGPNTQQKEEDGPAVIGEIGQEDAPINAQTEDLLSSLAPNEDPLSALAVSTVIKSPTRNDPLFSSSTQSPLVVDEESTTKVSASDVSSPTRKPGKPKKLFSSARPRRHPLNDQQKKDLFIDPLARKQTESDEFVDQSLDEDGCEAEYPVLPPTKDNLLQQVDAPLFKISPRKAKESNTAFSSLGNKDTKSFSREPILDQFDVEVVDPIKIGDLTSAHVEYTVKTKSNAIQPSECQVKRRYRDFRWLYRQLQNNNWGRIIPPPPEKQTVGRFKEDFIESRRFQMERMLKKISSDSILQKDEDFIMFLTSENFHQDSKIREHLTGSNASGDSNDISEIHISEIELLGKEDAEVVMKNGGLDGESHRGFMSISFSSLPKYSEPDPFFLEQRQETEILEDQLKQLYKSLELVDSQRSDLASVTEEFAESLKSLVELEVSKKSSELLLNFADVHLRIKESLQRSSLQESLTLGVTIDEYLRSLSSIRAVFNQRSKLGYYLVIVENDLSKKQAQLEKLDRTMKTQNDKIETVKQDLKTLKVRYSKVKNKWQNISVTIRDELTKHDQEKIKDFRNNIEIFLEAAIETQKECIELWETFYQNYL